MEYSKLEMVNGELVRTNIVAVNQKHLTEECWLVQISGLNACNKCELSGTDSCGGKKIIATGKNRKGYSIPLGK